MIQNLLKTISMESKQMSEDDLISYGIENDDISDAMLEDEKRNPTGSDITDTQIRELIDKIPESNTNLSPKEIGALAENFLVLLDNESCVFESNASIEAKIYEQQEQIQELLGDDSKKEALKEAYERLDFLEMVHKKNLETAEEASLDMMLFDDTTVLEGLGEEDFDDIFESEENVIDDLEEGLDDFDDFDSFEEGCSKESDCEDGECDDEMEEGCKKKSCESIFLDDLEEGLDDFDDFDSFEEGCSKESDCEDDGDDFDDDDEMEEGCKKSCEGFDDDFDFDFED